MAVKQAVQDVVWDEHIEREAPVVLFGTFAEYERTADKLSRGATDTLIWALHGTPLALIPAEAAYLTPSDVFFRDHGCRRKVRLVVFEYRRDLEWYLKARRSGRGEKVFTLRGKAKLQEAAARVRAFEDAAKSSGTLLFTATDILDKRLKEYKYSKLDAGYVSSDNGSTYCFHSPLSLRAAHPAIAQRRQEKIVLFKLSNNAHEEVPALPFYRKIFEEVGRHPNGDNIFFDTPEAVKKKVRRFMWPVKRTLEKSQNWLQQTGHRLMRNRSAVKAAISWIVFAGIVAFVIWQRLALWSRLQDWFPWL